MSPGDCWANLRPFPEIEFAGDAKMGEANSLGVPLRSVANTGLGLNFLEARGEYVLKKPPSPNMCSICGKISDFSEIGPYLVSPPTSSFQAISHQLGAI